MNDTRRGLILLMKSAVTGEYYALPAGFSMEEALPVIQKHHIVTLAYAGAVNCGISPQTDVMHLLFQQYCRQLLKSEQQMKAVDALYAAFEERKIDYMPLKGCNMKKLYPKPELRTMGDADILVRTGQYSLIQPLMLQLGYRQGLESDHEYIWQSRSLHLELHKKLIPSYNKDYFNYFGNGWKRALLKQGCRYALSLEDQFIFQFVHFAKHYRDGGIGCRHVVDLWVYRRSFPDLDEQYICAELDKLQLMHFYTNMVQLLRAWFEDAPFTEKTSFITRFIFDSGSWGSLEAHAVAKQAKEASGTGNARMGKLKGFIKSVFPACNEIEGRFPVLKKYPFLLPVIWVVRLIQVLLFQRDKVRKVLREQEMATVDKIETYQQALDYVGLHFNFK